MAAVVALGVLGLPATSYAASSSPAPIAPGVTHSIPLVRTYPDRPVTGLIVRTRDGKTPTAGVRAALTRLTGGPVVSGASASPRSLGGGMTRLSLGRSLSASQAQAVATQLAAQPGVISATPDGWVYPTSVVSPPSDSLFQSQWDMWNSSHAPTDYSTQALNAWAKTTGIPRVGAPQVVVAVLDTGLTVHPDLATATFSSGDPSVPFYGFDFVSPDPGTFYAANDGNGWDNNPSDPGDWITPDESSGKADGGIFQNCPVSDSSWHGTHVAGTIAASANGVGTIGAAPDIKIEPVRVLGKCGGQDSDIWAAMRWASGIHVDGVPDNTHPAKVINLSLGSPLPTKCSAEWQSAINAVRGQGTTVVVAAGNSTDASSLYSPADCRGVIDVEATTPDGSLASYSNSGIVPGSVTIAAPGGDAVGTSQSNPVPPGYDPLTGFRTGSNVLSTYNSGAKGPGNPSYAADAGTSMATPHVSAAVALMQTLADSTLTPDQVAARLASTSTEWPAGTTCTKASCGGILNIAAALPDPPSAPVDFAASAGIGKVNLRWSAPVSTNGAPLLHFHLQARAGSDPWKDVDTSLPASSTSMQVTKFADSTPLTDATSYEFSLTAVNAVGESTAATSSAVTILPSALPPPDPPAAPSVTGQVEHLTVTWAPASGAPTSYAVRYRKVGASTWTCATGVSGSGISGCGVVPASKTSLTTTTWPTAMSVGVYEAEVAASNADGASVWSDVGLGTVRALSQSVRISSAYVRPFVDGYQDSTAIQVTSNRRGGDSGTLSITDSRGHLVRQLSLSTASVWNLRWDGRTATGARAADGVYTVSAHLLGRGAATTVIASNAHITVLTTQASTPTMWLPSRTFFPVVDGYRDRLTVAAHNTVPTTFAWSVVRAGRTYWHATSVRGTSAVLHFDGRMTTGALLPAGTYTLQVVAKAGEGVARATSTTFTVNRAHAVRAWFRVSGTAAGVLQGVASGSTAWGTYGTGGITVPASSIITFAAPLPGSVLPYVGVGVIVRSHGAVGGAPLAAAAAGWYSGDPLAPVLGPSRQLTATTTLSPATATAAQIAGGRARFFVQNAAAGSSWAVVGYTVYGYRFVLVP